MFGIKIMKKSTYDGMERDLCHLREEKCDLLDRIAKMGQGEDNELVCDGYCEHCKHGMDVSTWFGKAFACALDIPCKKFTRINPEE